jgi:hypothetical protein
MWVAISLGPVHDRKREYRARHIGYDPNLFGAHPTETSAMPVKIFEAGGKDAIKKMEAEINAWFASLGTQRVKQMTTAASSVKDPGADEVFQHLFVTFLYD